MRWARYTAFKNPDAPRDRGGAAVRALHLFPASSRGRSPSCRCLYVKYCINRRQQDVLLAIARGQTAMQHPRGPVMVSVSADDWTSLAAAPPRLAGYRDISSGRRWHRRAA